MTRPDEALSDEQRGRWWEESGRGELEQLLFWRWDPIGVRDAFPFTADEYRDPAAEIGGALIRGASVDEIDGLLRKAEEDMGLGGNGEDGDRVRRLMALEVLEWQVRSVEHWRTAR